MSEVMSPDELEAWEHLGRAYGAFNKLEQTHPSHVRDFTDGIHICQHIIGQRILQRQAPQHFASYYQLFGVWTQVKPEEDDAGNNG